MGLPVEKENRVERAPCQFRWHKEVEYGLSPVNSSQILVSFYKRSNTILRIKIEKDLINRLFSILDENSSKQNEQVQSADLDLDLVDQSLLKLLNILYEKNIVSSVPRTHAVLNLYFDFQTKFCTRLLPSEKSITIDLLVGDEWTLERNFSVFLATRDSKSLIGTLTLLPEMVELSAISSREDALIPRKRTTFARAYPGWQTHLRQVIDIVAEKVGFSLIGSDWFSLTARGVRLPMKWEESRSRYRFEVAPLSVGPDVDGIFYAQAKIEEGLLCAGTGRTLQQASFSAVAEAWERYALDRPDLADEAQDGITNDLSKFPGVQFDYLRRLCPPLDIGPRYVQGHWVEDYLPVKVPTEWVYFGNYSGSNTNGAAFGNTLEDAVYSAKLEVIERHALLSCYLQRWHAEELPVEETLVALTGQVQRKCRFYRLATWESLEIIAVVLSSSQPPFFTMGAAARTNLLEAAQKAFNEACAVELIWIKEIERLGFRGFLENAEKLLTAAPKDVGLIESGRVWAGMKNGAELLHSIFTGANDRTLRKKVCPNLVQELKPEGFIYTELSKNLFIKGQVVKVLHPLALPLPSSFEQALVLADITNSEIKFPIPMT